MKQIVNVENMSCQNCVKHVSNHFLTLAGVSAVEVDLDKKEAVVTTDTAHTLAEYQASLEETVYEAVAVR